MNAITILVLGLLFIVSLGNILYISITSGQLDLDCDNDSNCQVVIPLVGCAGVSGFILIIALIMGAFKHKFDKSLAFLMGFLTLTAGASLGVTNYLNGEMDEVKYSKVSWILNFVSGGLGLIGGLLTMFH